MTDLHSILPAGISPTLLILAVVWTLIWKGLALWRSATLREKWWFIAILVINTFGILEIIYLLMKRGYKVEVVEK
jgi:hypothetical protein